MNDTNFKMDDIAMDEQLLNDMSDPYMDMDKAVWDDLTAADDVDIQDNTELDVNDYFDRIDEEELNDERSKGDQDVMNEISDTPSSDNDGLYMGTTSV